MSPPVIARADPCDPELALLHERHTADMHAETPPESIHMLSADALALPGIDFFVIREDGRPVGMGALKRIDPGHAEIKSMHVLAEARGRGLSRFLLDHLIAHARAEGCRRISLETGAEPICPGPCALRPGRLCRMRAVRGLSRGSPQRLHDAWPCLKPPAAAKGGHAVP